MSCAQQDGSEHEVGPLKYRVMEFPTVGYHIAPHSHEFDHATLCVRGKVLVFCDAAHARELAAEHNGMPVIFVHADDIAAFKAS